MTEFLNFVVSLTPVGVRELTMEKIPQALVVDDDITSCKVVAAMLKHLGCEAHCFLDSGAALQALLDRSYDMLFLDWLMPVLSGHQMLTAIRSGDAGPHNSEIPIIVLTADLIRSPRDVCLAAGANDYLAKPLRFHRLSEIIQEII